MSASSAPVVHIIDPDAALEVLEHVVANHGTDHVDDSSECHYQQHGAPVCLVGHALQRLGVPIDLLVELDDNHGGDGGSLAITDVDRPELVFKGNAQTILGIAQCEQDDGHSWGTALARVHEYVTLHQQAHQLATAQ